MMPMPICARCGREVEQMTWIDDPAGTAIRFVVRCHGAREETTLHASLIAAGGPGLRVEAGVAFAHDALRRAILPPCPRR